MRIIIPLDWLILADVARREWREPLLGMFDWVKEAPLDFESQMTSVDFKRCLFYLTSQAWRNRLFVYERCLRLHVNILHRCFFLEPESLNSPTQFPFYSTQIIIRMWNKSSINQTESNWQFSEKKSEDKMATIRRNFSFKSLLFTNWPSFRVDKSGFESSKMLHFLYTLCRHRKDPSSFFCELHSFFRWSLDENFNLITLRTKLDSFALFALAFSLEVFFCN